MCGGEHWWKLKPQSGNEASLLFEVVYLFTPSWLLFHLLFCAPNVNWHRVGTRAETQHRHFLCKSHLNKTVTVHVVWETYWNRIVSIGQNCQHQQTVFLFFLNDGWVVYPLCWKREFNHYEFSCDFSKPAGMWEYIDPQRDCTARKLSEGSEAQAATIWEVLVVCLLCACEWVFSHWR